MSGYTFRHVRMCRPEGIQLFSTLLILRQALSLNPELPDSGRLSGQRALVSTSLGLGSWAHTAAPGFYMLVFTLTQDSIY